MFVTKRCYSWVCFLPVVSSVDGTNNVGLHQTSVLLTFPASRSPTCTAKEDNQRVGTFRAFRGWNYMKITFPYLHGHWSEKLEQIRSKIDHYVQSWWKSELRDVRQQLKKTGKSTNEGRKKNRERLKGAFGLFRPQHGHLFLFRRQPDKGTGY